MKKSSAASLNKKIRRYFILVNLVLWGAIGGWYLLQSPARQREVERLVGNYFDSRKKVSSFDVAWDLWHLYYSRDYVDGVVPGNASDLYGGMPVLETAVATRSVRVLVNPGFSIGYGDELGNPLWAAYRLADGRPGEPLPRPERFEPDRRTVARVEPSDYSRSGYDRGHMVPSFAMAVHHGRAAQEATFLMSNISPQKHTLNAGVWKDLEQRIALNYPARFGEVWVYVGPVFGRNPSRLKQRVALPEAFFMIIIDENEGRTRAQAFLFPQDAPGEAEAVDYLTTIDDIERRTGLDFLSQLPDEAEEALERRRSSRVW